MDSCLRAESECSARLIVHNNSLAAICHAMRSLLFQLQWLKRSVDCRRTANACGQTIGTVHTYAALHVAALRYC